MKNKGFVLMETIIVIVVISVALLTIFASYNKILTKVKTENKYDTSEYIYMTYHIKESLNDSIEAQKIDEASTLTNYKETINNIFDVEKIYILTNLDKFGNNEKKVDAYMIDYIRKLDVRNNDELIIVEYKKPVMDPINYEQKKDSNGNELYETYIASLEW